MSDIEIVIIEKTTEVVSPELKREVLNCGNIKSVTKYLARNRNSKEELGLLCTDHLGNILIIYRIYVIPGHRNVRIGTILLEHGEKLARKLECVRVGGEPRTLDPHFDQELLEAWYKRHGYCDREGKNLMKSLV